MSVPSSEANIPCLNLAVDRLSGTEARRYVTWVIRAPYTSGYVLHDRDWQAELSQAWAVWQMMFSQDSVLSAPEAGAASTLALDTSSEPSMNYSSRLMQHMGIRLWQWLFDGVIGRSLDKSQGVALGQKRSLRLRLEVRDADLIRLPWEIMQADAGQRAISLGSTVFFSRTISEVESLPRLRQDAGLRILMVVGQPELETGHNVPPLTAPSVAALNPEQDIEELTQALQAAAESGLTAGTSGALSGSRVTALVQPTSADLIEHLNASSYNLFVYAGHGAPGPDGGRLFLSPGTEINGIELAQVLTRRQVKLAVFNACWGARSDRDAEGKAIPRSSLAEVLICQGVPAVLGMRDAIADSEAFSFIRALTAALLKRGSVDAAVAEARQQLLTLYKFNRPTWTLPVLYMHPEFNGQILSFQEEGTEIPEAPPTWINQTTPTAALRTVDALPGDRWPIQSGIMRVGKERNNDLILRGPGVSRKHAEIFYRGALASPVQQPAYYLRDFSRFGTFIRQTDGWRRIHNEEVPLTPHIQIKFGSPQNPSLEFIVEDER